MSKKRKREADPILTRVVALGVGVAILAMLYQQANAAETPPTQ